VIRKTFVIHTLLILGVSTPALAQRPASADQQLRSQLQKFEAALTTAVQLGGEAFARDRKEAIPPGVELTADPPQVRGFAPPESNGIIFYVAVPTIRIAVNQLLLQGENVAARQRRDGLQPTGRQAQTAQGLIAAPDPMTASPVVPEGTCAERTKPSKGYSNPNYEYAVAVCDALMDAMLDSSGPLTLKDDDWLTVMAVSGDPALPGVINSEPSYVTYLYVKGADLMSFRQGKISKAEARQLIQLTQR